MADCIASSCVTCPKLERGLSSPSLNQAEKSSGRTARHRSEGKNLSSRLVRRGFSRYPYHCLNGAISTVQTCAKARLDARVHEDRKSTRLNSSHLVISYAVFCLKKKKNNNDTTRYKTSLY